MNSFRLGGGASVVAAAAFLALGLSTPVARAQQPADAPAPVAPAPEPVAAPSGQPGAQVVIVQQQAAPAPAYGNMRGADWEPGDPVPPGYHPESEIRKGLVIAGSVTLGSTWLLFGVLPAALTLDVCTSVGEDCGIVGTLFVPAVGPFIAMPFATKSTVAEVLLAFDGLAQSSGLVMLILGLALQKDVLVKDVAIGDTKMQIMPTPMSIGATGHGFGLVGTF